MKAVAVIPVVVLCTYCAKERSSQKAEGEFVRFYCDQCKRWSYDVVHKPKPKEAKKK
jgi:hypothetical protein